MKTYKQLPIPKKSPWDRKSYDPILWIYKRFGNPVHLDGMFDLYFIPKEFILKIYNYIRNVIRWSPTLYKDRDWDGDFIYEILKQKLIYQRKELVNSNRHTNVWMENRDITICLNLIERIQNDFYELEYHEYYEDRFWFEPTGELYGDGQKMYTMNSVNVTDNLSIYFDKYKLDTNRVTKESYKNFDIQSTDYKEKQRISMYVSSYRSQKAKNLLFKILAERIDWWWD